MNGAAGNELLAFSFSWWKVLFFGHYLSYEKMNGEPFSQIKCQKNESDLNCLDTKVKFEMDKDLYSEEECIDFLNKLVETKCEEWNVDNNNLQLRNGNIICLYESVF